MQTVECDEVATAHDAAVERQALRWTRSQSIPFLWLFCDRPRDKRMPPARFLLLPTSTHSPVRARARVRARSREANSTRVLPAPAECGHLESHAYAVSITGPIFCQLCRGPSEPAVGISVDSECMRAFCSSILMQACREFPYQHICWRRPACQVATKSRPSSMSH